MSYNLQLRENYYVITGGPGSGKSTLLDALAVRGFTTVAEVGRQIIQDELANGGNAIHTGDRIAFRHKMMTQSIADYLNQPKTDKPVFFDRGIPDLIGYSYLIGREVPPEYLQTVNALRYNPLIFIAPPWPAIYQHDELRKQYFQEAINTYQAIGKGYLENGYQLVELPLVDVDERVLFILKTIQNN